MWQRQPFEKASDVSVFSTSKPGEGGYTESHCSQASDAENLARLSDTHLAVRKANQTAERRFEAAAWLQVTVGPLNFPAEPSEEDLRLCLRNGLVLCNLINKIHPGAVPKIVENPPLSCPSPEGAALCAYQYFENVRNFLVAVKQLKLPSFEASDLEKGTEQGGLLAQVVDCILSLKAYLEWQQGGKHGIWKFGAPIKYPCFPKSLTKALSDSRSNNSVEGLSHCGKIRARRSWEYEECWSTDSDLMEGSGNAWHDFDPNLANRVEQACRQFVDLYLATHKSPCELNMHREPLLKLVMEVLGGRQSDKLPMVVEFMLKKAIEECEQRLTSPQGNLQKMQCIDWKQAHRLGSQAHELKELRCELEASKLQIQDMQFGWNKELESIHRTIQGLARAAAEYHKVAAENRELYNQVQDLKGSIRVYCRVRPFLPGQNSSRSTVDFIGERGSIVIVNPAKQGKDQRKAFTFNKVFGPSAEQEEVFLDTQPLIRSVMDGFNVCIFAYGQTGSGKTYTMTGPHHPSPKDWGVNFRALHDLFQISQSRRDVIKYEVGVQMIEIYNEQVRDLLCMEGLNKKLEIRNSSQHNGLNVPDASMVLVSSTEDVLQLMNMGQRNRAFGCTALNERSSRSHSVLTVHVKGTDLSVGAILRGCLHLIDLAGSERVDKSLATGDRLKEAQHINKSLSALGDVIAALAQKSPHVPYRNSKLTQLLQDSLGGQAKTLMFVHVSPDYDSYGETISTLKFAERVAIVELGACCSNKESGEVRDLKNQIAFLKDALNKKERELERLQRDSREKGTVSIQDRAQVRSGAQPIEHTSVSLQGHDTSLPGYYGFHGQEHAAKQRASKLPRQTLSSDSRTSSLNSDLSYQAPSPPLQGNGNLSTNKNRITSNESASRALSRHDRLSISSRSVIVHTHLHHYYGGNEMECSDDTHELSEAGGFLQNGQTKHSGKKESFKVPRLHPSAPPNVIPSLRCQLKSGQVSAEVSSCTMEIEDDGETSDYSEVELWHKDSSKAADEHRKVEFLSTAESKRRQDREKRHMTVIR